METESLAYNNMDEEKNIEIHSVSFYFKLYGLNIDKWGEGGRESNKYGPNGDTKFLGQNILLIPKIYSLDAFSL